MKTELIHDRGRGPELKGTRITVYNLLPDFLGPTVTEEHICRAYNLTPEQVAAARAYVLNNPDTVLARHLEIEARIAIGNPPEVIERAKKSHETFLRFKEWLAERGRAGQASDHRGVESSPNPTPFPEFRQWLAERESRHGAGS